MGRNGYLIASMLRNLQMNQLKLSTASQIADPADSRDRCAVVRRVQCILDD
jgi:hypothetical protein